MRREVYKMGMNIEPNYKNKKHYNMKKPPIRQPIFIVGLIWVLSKIALIGKKYKIEKQEKQHLMFVIIF